MISALDSRVMDANAEALGISVETLMGNAGKAIADYISTNYPGKKIAFFCGHGNNGGDGFAAACHLPKELTEIYCITGPEKIKSRIVRNYLDKSGIVPRDAADCSFDFDVLVDCGLGTGISGELRPEYADYVRRANEFEGVKIAVDVPTGLGTADPLKADVTLTMHDLKEGMNGTDCGRIIIEDICMPPKAYEETGPGDMLRYPVPAPSSHKGSNGNLLIIGGGPYFGAPAMAGLGALRVGTDLVTIAAPESAYHEIASYSPVLMIRKLEGDHLTQSHIEKILEDHERYSAVLIGPGLGRDPETMEAVRAFVSSCKVPLVIDADGLTAISEKPVKFKTLPILTPHRNEYLRIGGKDSSRQSVQGLASSIGAVILLKGKEDVISDGKHTKSNLTGCAGMTGAGTGDVLAGIVAGLLSKGLDRFDSACLGAYISGKAGEMAFSKLSYGMIATDVIESVPAVLKSGLEGRKN